MIRGETEWSCQKPHLNYQTLYACWSHRVTSVWPNTEQRRSTRRFEQITAQIKRLLVKECWIQMFDLDQKPFQCKVLSRDYENGQTCSAIQNSLSMSLDKNVWFYSRGLTFFKKGISRGLNVNFYIRILRRLRLFARNKLLRSRTLPSKPRESSTPHYTYNFALLC